MDRLFFDWNSPFLPKVAEYLFKRYKRSDRTLDLSNVIVAVPGSRAKRRLEELLFFKVEKTEPDWIPPTILTLGSLPELLYPLKTALADDLVQQIAWVKSVQELHQADRETLLHVIPHPPSMEDWNSLLAYGQIFSRLHMELAAEGLDFQDVTSDCDSQGLSGEKERWEALAKLQNRYHAILDAIPLWDVQTARIHAVKENECKTDHDIILAGLVDLNRIQRQILSAVSERITALVFAPEDWADLFDDFGCVNAKLWQDRQLDIPEELIEPTDTPADQATAVLHWLYRLDGRFGADEIVIGIPDTSVEPLLSQQLKQVNLTSRHVAGTPVSQTPICLFLDAVSQYLESRSYTDFATLLRHPDVERFLRNRHKTLSGTDNHLPDFSQYLTELDTYHENHIPMLVGDSWLLRPRKESDDDRIQKNQEEENFLSEEETSRQYSLLCWISETLNPLFANLLSDEQEKRNLADWVAPLRNFLLNVYGSQTFSSHDMADHIRKKSFEALRGIFDRFENMPEQIMPQLTVLDALTLLLRLFRTVRIPPLPGDADLELIGWLDLPLDDAPAMIVTGLNDGIVPSSKISDPFLPDTMRRRLGLEDNRKRYARDAYALTAILNSRQEKRFIFGRQTLRKDPLVPSRLFFATDEQTLAERVKRYFKEEKSVVKPVFAGSLRPGSESEFKTPPPLAEDLTSGSMRVTEFRDYLNCPYRYYLMHCLKLNVCTDESEELDHAGFGDLIHKTLKQFGRENIKKSQNADDIYQFLDEQLDKVAREQFGSSFRPVIAIQLEQARLRLRYFAQKQADWAKKHEIIHVEYDPGLNGANIIDVDGKPIRIRGRIDRVDVDLETGKHILFDYKTSGAGDSPEKVHMKKGEWIDLQLPLYRMLYGCSLEDDAEIETGFITLPKKAEETQFQTASWQFGDYVEAEQVAKNVVRNIRKKVFWPPKTSPLRYAELYASICLE